MSGAEVGLGITQATALTGMVQWGMRQSAEVANQLMSVERVLEYEELPVEKQPSIPKKPSENWPSKGAIEFKDMGLKYDEEGALVLKHLNIHIEPKEKVKGTTFLRLVSESIFLGWNCWTYRSW